MEVEAKKDKERLEEFRLRPGVHFFSLLCEVIERDPYPSKKVSSTSLSRVNMLGTNSFFFFFFECFKNDFIRLIKT